MPLSLNSTSFSFSSGLPETSLSTSFSWRFSSKGGGGGGGGGGGESLLDNQSLPLRVSCDGELVMETLLRGLTNFLRGFSGKREECEVEVLRGLWVTGRRRSGELVAGM